MPSREGQVYEPNLVPPPLHPVQKVWVCRFTGALFASYEDYLKQLAAYRQRVWSCKHSGKANLCYEEALTEEARCQGLLEKFPTDYERPVTKLVHHATLKTEDLCQRLVTYFKDRFVPGEVVLGQRDGVLTACRISSAVDPTDLEHDSQVLSSAAAVIPPDPEDEYSVEWLSDGVTQLLKRYELTRKNVPLTRAVMKSWLPSAAEAETVAGVKGIPCIWRVNGELQERYGLQSQIPDTIKERIERAQQRRAEQSTRRPSQVEQDFIQMDAGEVDDQDDEDYEESMSGKTVERKSDAKRTVPVEPLEKTRERLKEGTVKRVLFDVLEIAGQQGMSIQGLVEAVQAAGVKQWEGARSANSSIAATCTHDFAFVRVGPGQIALRALKHDTMQVSAPAAARAQSEERVIARSPAFERNNFKCPKCHKSHHPDNSPLVLCDSCPRSYHLACLDLAFQELPEDEWQCPKCTDRKLGTGRRLASSYARSDAYERLPLGDSDDRALMRGLSRWERDRRRLDDRSDKERARDETRSLRERAREAAKWAALHPLDDLELLEDEEEALASVEMEAQAAGEEAERAAQRAEGKPEGALADRVARLQRRAKKASERAATLKLVIEGPSAVEPGVSAAASKTALYDALSIVDFLTIFGASFEAAPLSLLEVQQAAAFPLDIDHLSHLYIALLRCLLIEAMAMEGVVRSRAKRWGRIIDESTWPEILRRYLFASRAGLPVPEILNDVREDVDTANMDDHTACIVGAKLMSEMPFHRLRAGMHLRILVALCNDVTECTTLRNEISARVEEMNQIQAEFRHKQNEDRKRQKEEATKVVVPELPAEEPAQDPTESQAAEVGREAVKGMGEEGDEESRKLNQAEDSGDAGKAEGVEEEEPPIEPLGEPQVKPKTTEEGGEPPEEHPGEESGGPKVEEEGQTGEGEATDPPKPNFDLPEDLKEYKGSKRDKKEMQAWKSRRSEEVERLAKEKGAWDRQQKERRRKRQKGTAGKKQAKAADAEKDYGEELREREAALEEAMDARAIRGEMLGQDRHYRRYWWYPGEPSVIFVEEQEGTAVGTLDAPEQLEALMERLNQHGLREKLLFQNLVKRKDMVLSSLGYHTVNLDVAAAPRPRPEADAEAAATGLGKAAVQASVKKLCEFLDQLDDVPAAPVETSVDAWKARLAAVGTQEELGTAVLDLEADINGLGSGLPTGADDASLAGFGKNRKNRTANELGGKAGSATMDDELPNGKLDMDEPPSKRASETPEGAYVKTETQPANGSAVVASEQVVAAAKPEPMVVDRPALSVQNASAPKPQDGVPTVASAGTLTTKAPDVNLSADALNGDGVNGSINEQQDATADGGSGLDQAVKSQMDTSKMDVDIKPESNDRFDENLSATECVERLFKDSDYMMPFDYVNPPEELDASDSEASKNRRGGTLWRSARERKAWLKDARRGLHSREASVIAYVAAVLVDRAQPLLRSLIRATKRAEKEAAEWEALEAAAAHQPSSTEGTPAPQAKAVKSAGKSERASNPKGKRSRHSVDTGGKLTGRLSEGPVNKKPKTSAPKPAEDDDSEATISDDDHPAKPVEPWNLACQVCGEGGDLLRCEAPDCPVAEHVACAGLDDPPTTDWYCTEHRNKPSLKRKRARSAAKDAAAFVRRSAEPRPSPPRKSTGRIGKGATAEDDPGKRGTTKRRR